MQTRRFDPSEIEIAAQELRDGELIAFPTETVYGLGADATNETAVKNVYVAKGRPSDNPLIVHVSDVETVEKYAQPLSNDARKLIKAFWPGPLTLIFPLKPNALSKSVTGGLQTAAFRMPDNKATLRLIDMAGVPMVGPSANTSGKPSPTTADHVLHDLNGKIAGVLDDGPTRVGLESTVLDMSTDTPVILRPGAVDEAAISAVIGPIGMNHHQVAANETPKAPGMKYKHYAPAADVTIVDQLADWEAALKWAAAQPTTVAVMATDDVLATTTVPANVETWSLGSGIAEASHRLFSGLREFDNRPEVTQILAQAFDVKGLGGAYMNRLNKSAGGAHFG